MPQADIPYIIGVIREKEKSLLEADEYTRIRGAANAAEAAHAFSDTAYGMHLASAAGPLAAISERLADEFEWLVEVFGADHAIITFIAARFDALHIAAALIDTHTQEERASHTRSLGTMSAELISSCVRDDAGWESVPQAWRAFLQAETKCLAEPNWTKGAAIERVKDQMLHVMRQSANGELAQSIVALTKKRLEQEATIRPNDLPSDLIAFERNWDEELLALLRPWRADAVQADAVLAWWYALATEAKTLRLVLSAKISGFSDSTLEQLQRSFYRKWI